MFIQKPLSLDLNQLKLSSNLTCTSSNDFLVTIDGTHKVTGEVTTLLTLKPYSTNFANSYCLLFLSGIPVLAQVEHVLVDLNNYLAGRILTSSISRPGPDYPVKLICGFNGAYVEQRQEITTVKLVSAVNDTGYTNDLIRFNSVTQSLTLTLGDMAICDDTFLPSIYVPLMQEMCLRLKLPEESALVKHLFKLAW